MSPHPVNGCCSIYIAMHGGWVEGGGDQLGLQAQDAVPRTPGRVRRGLPPPPPGVKNHILDIGPLPRVAHQLVLTPR